VALPTSGPPSPAGWAQPATVTAVSTPAPTTTGWRNLFLGTAARYWCRDPSGRQATALPTVVAMATIDRPFGRHLEDFEVGDVYRHWPGKTITEYDDHLFCMITMNHHPLHTNEWYAENETVQKRNVVVGNLVYSLVLGLSVPDVSGAAVANLEIDTLKHAKPTFHGDTIYAVTRVLEKKETSDGKRGIVTVETKGINQREEEVCYFKRRLMVWKREFAPARQYPYGDEVFAAD
jgi:acyl dehydratase